MKKLIQYSILYFILATQFIISCPHDNHAIVPLESADALEKLLKNNQGPCLVYLYMHECGWCKEMAPLVQKLAEDDKYCDQITFYQADGPKTQAAKLLLNYMKKKIEGYPTLIFMNAGKLSDVQVGGTSLKILEQKLTKLLK